MSWNPNQGQDPNQPGQYGNYGGQTPPQQPGNPYNQPGAQGQYGQQGSPNPYGQQQYGSQYSAPPAANASALGTSSTGLQPNVAAGLGYLVGIIGIIFFFIEKQSRFVRFHGAQAILLAIASVVWLVVFFILFFISFAAAAATNGGGLFIAINCLSYLGFIAIGVGALIAMIQAFMGKYFKLPVIGDMAERMVGPNFPA